MFLSWMYRIVDDQDQFNNKICIGKACFGFAVGCTGKPTWTSYILHWVGLLWISYRLNCKGHSASD